MAQIINLRENEYQTIVSELEKMHENQLKNVADIIMEMKMLVASDDIFSANLTSQKMVSMLDTISDDVMMLLMQVFLDSEAGIFSMITSTIDADSVSG